MSEQEDGLVSVSEQEAGFVVYVSEQEAGFVVYVSEQEAGIVSVSRRLALL